MSTNTTTNDDERRLQRNRSSSPLHFIPPMFLLRRLRRAATVIAASTALTLVPTRPQSVQATPRPATVLFDRSYTGTGVQSNIWEDLGMNNNDNNNTTTSTVQSTPALKPIPKRLLVEDELRILMRLVVAATVGGIIGLERRSAKSFAGVRTFSLVSLGAAIFLSTVLIAAPQADPARIAAAISSSVGFIGGGVMSKNSKQSRGLTTATSVWLAAGLGVAAASGLFVLAYAGAVMTVLIARYARFDNSLHLIRGDPLVNYDTDDPVDEDLITSRERSQKLSSSSQQQPLDDSNELEEQPQSSSYSGNGSPSELGRRGTSSST